MALSYAEASSNFKSGRISWDEYADQLFARFAGDGHPDDEHDRPWDLLESDRFAYALYCWSERRTGHKDTGALRSIFDAYHENKGVEALNTLLGTLGEDEDRESAKKILAQLALEDRRVDVLKWVIDLGGFPFEGYFLDEADKVDETRDPDAFKVLEESQFRTIHPREAWPSPGLVADNDDDGDFVLNPAQLDSGGSHPVPW